MAALVGKVKARIASATVLALLAAVVPLLISCGGAETETGLRALEAGVITATGKSYSIEDLKAVGYKLSKTYDVTGLPQARSAYFGFWGLDPYNRSEFEVRFYPDHATAVRHGQDLARERVGPGAKLTEDSATWKVGVVEARECFGIRGQSQHAASCMKAVFYDYANVDNMIMLCPGDDLETARKNCAELLALLN